MKGNKSKMALIHTEDRLISISGDDVTHTNCLRILDIFVSEIWNVFSHNSKWQAAAQYKRVHVFGSRVCLCVNVCARDVSAWNELNRMNDTFVRIE